MATTEEEARQEPASVPEPETKPPAEPLRRTAHSHIEREGERPETQEAAGPG